MSKKVKPPQENTKKPSKAEEAKKSTPDTKLPEESGDKNLGETPTDTATPKEIIPEESTTTTNTQEPKAPEGAENLPEVKPEQVAMMANMPHPNIVLGVTALKEVFILKTIEDLGRAPKIILTDEVRNGLTPSTLVYAVADIEVKREMEVIKSTVKIKGLLYAHEL